MSLRRVRAILQLTVLWSLGVGVVGTLAVLVRLLFSSTAGSLTDVLIRAPSTFLWFAGWGGLAGLVFAGALIFAARRRGWEALSSRAVAMWGALPGVLVALAAAAPMIHPQGSAAAVIAEVLTVALFLGGSGSMMALAQLNAARRLPAGRMPAELPTSSTP
jgi:hypothetical protein